MYPLNVEEINRRIFTLLEEMYVLVNLIFLCVKGEKGLTLGQSVNMGITCSACSSVEYLNIKTTNWFWINELVWWRIAIQFKNL